jgi:hypothetical protein
MPSSLAASHHPGLSKKKEVKEEETEVDRSDVKPPSPFSS